MTTAMPPARLLHLVVGYDGSPPASRALDAAVRLLQDRTAASTSCTWPTCPASPRCQLTPSPKRLHALKYPPADKGSTP
jgi:hypothetical protein